MEVSLTRIGNTNLIYAILKSKKRFEALRAFTLESGQEEIERAARRRKEILSGNDENIGSPARAGSSDSGFRSPQTRSSTLTDVPEEDSTFTIGADDSDDETETELTPDPSSPSLHNSRTPSVTSEVDNSVPVQLRGMSERARGKMPVGQMAFSRQNSTTSLNSHSAVSRSGSSFCPPPQWVCTLSEELRCWLTKRIQIETWLPDLPLHTILSLIQAISPSLPSSASSRNPSGSPNSSTVRDFISAIPTFKEHPLLQPILYEPSPPLTHSFQWTPLSLGWYESLLWASIFTSEMVVGSRAKAAGTAGAVGVWNGTHIRLFQVQQGDAEGPSLMRPMGAVDAVGNNIVQRIGSLGLGGKQPSGAGPVAASPRSGGT